MNLSTVIVVLVIVAIWVIAYHTGPEAVTLQQAAEMETVGFWSGLWHGLIVFPVWIMSWFSDQITIYAIYNNGGWYNFGYILGISGLFGLLR